MDIAKVQIDKTKNAEPNVSDKIRENKVPWFRRRKSKEKDNLENHRKSFFCTIRRKFTKKFKSNSQNKVKSTDNLNPLEEDTNDEFSRLFINNTQHPIVFSSPVTRDNSQDDLFNEASAVISFQMPNNSSVLSQEVIQQDPVPLEQISAAPIEISIPQLEIESTQGSEAAGLDRVQEDFDEMLIKIKNNLIKYPWYWPDLSRVEAQKLLAGKSNGSFLVRDSSTEKKFTLSFRSSGVTLHCRIEYKDNLWSYIENTKSSSIEALIESNIEQSKSSIIGFVKQNSQLYPPFPVRLSIPVFRCVPLLQDLCISCIKSQVAAYDVKNVTKLPLPSKMKEFVRDNFNTL